MKRVLILAAFLCLVALAADNAVVDRQSIVQSPSSIVDGTDAITIPQMLSYQGKLTDTFGLPVPDTLYAIRFRLYAQPTGGTQFWQENQSVRTTDGLFSVLLGSVTPIGSVPDAGTAYLGMAVGGGAELTPRRRIASAAYAYLSSRAANSDLLQGKDTTGLDARYVNESQAGSVTSAMIVNGTIVASDLGQMGAASGQVMKWTGSAWAPRNDSVGTGGTGTVTSVGQATGVVCVPNPITTTGTVRFDSTYGDGRYVNAAGDSMSGRLVVTGSDGTAAVYGISDTSGWSGRFENTSGTGGAGCFGYANHAVLGYIGTRGNSDAGVGLVGYNNNATYYAVRAQNAAGSTAPGLRIDGTSYFTGAKTGFVADLCRNASGRVLEPGDVVVVTGCEPAVLGSVPVPLVAKADKAGQTGVVGVVDSRQIVDPAGTEPDDGPTAMRANPAQVRHAPGSIEPGDYLLVATLGAYQGVRIDASYGSVRPGDLLVTSPHAGFAMRTDSPQTGTVVGKALSGLDAGTGLIPIIILQQ